MRVRSPAVTCGGGQRGRQDTCSARAVWASPGRSSTQRHQHGHTQHPILVSRWPSPNTGAGAPRRRRTPGQGGVPGVPGARTHDVETGFPTPLHRRAGAEQTAPEASWSPRPASPHQCGVTAPMCSRCCASVPVPAGPRERRGRQKTARRTHTPTPAGKHMRSLTCAQFQSTCPRQ